MTCTPPRRLSPEPEPLNPYQALLSDLEDWVERLETADDLPGEALRVAADMRAALAAAGREVS